MTKILFVDNDEMSFEFRKCMARVLAQLPPLELFHAGDATEALSLLDQIHPDVVVLDDELAEEGSLFIDSLSGTYPPVILQTEPGQKPRSPSDRKNVTVLPKNETLDGIHKTLLIACAIAERASVHSTDLVS